MTILISQYQMLSVCFISVIFSQLGMNLVILLVFGNKFQNVIPK